MIQVKKEHYFKGNYDSHKTFARYWLQINEVLTRNVENVLDIGCGNKLVMDYLNREGIETETFDFDKELEPTYIGDVRSMSLDKRYDMVICCEVLEHIPLNDVDKALENIYKTTNKYAIISIPYYYMRFGITFYGDLNFVKWFKTFRINIPYFFIKPKFSSQHYWSIGQKGISKNKFRKMIKENGFKIIEEKFPSIYTGCIFFILEKEYKNYPESIRSFHGLFVGKNFRK